MSKQYRVINVATNGFRQAAMQNAAYELIEALKDGWEIITATPATDLVQYVVSKDD